ncbi:hypothetical protein GWK48_07025 [Metallosphaera tengchongensis]|uniref:Uncharacterized protein n=1 Tax=Metallosphaera tengchongensis TaxID=1532350 RepID=A0A6N0NVC7_9CREN|nr:hypothetical protein [Metallosphaera tengchongensis]QKR00157.1 hypothetical protein GWK48_07025 [Metallosphaera tengchongensis]
MDLRIFMALLIVLIVVSTFSIYLVLRDLTTQQKVPYISPSTIDQKLGGQWRLDVVENLKYPDTINPPNEILSLLENSSESAFFILYVGDESNLSMFIYKYQNSSSLSKLVLTIQQIYNKLGWRTQDLNGSITGFTVQSNDSQFLYGAYHNYVVVVYLNGVVYPNESVEVANLESHVLT